MIIELYTLNCDVRLLTKIYENGDISRRKILSGDLKDSIDISNPVINIQYDNQNEPYSLHEYNYSYIPDLNRYYFINKIICVRNNIYEIHMHVDVLNSFSSRIRNLYCIVNRSTSHFDPLLKDDLQSFNYNDNVTYQEIATNCFYDFSSTPAGSVGATFIANVINKTPNEPIFQGTFSKVGALQKPSNWFSTDTPYNNKLILGISSIKDFVDKIIDDEYAASSVLSLRYYPNIVPIYGIRNCKWTTVNGTEIGTFSLIEHATNQIYEVCDFPIYAFGGSKSYLDFKPYRYLTIYLPFYGTFELDNNRYVDRRIRIQLIVDYNTGQGKYVLSDYYEHTLLDDINFKIGVDIGLSYTNVASNNLREEKVLTDIGASTITSIGQAGVAIASAYIGNYGMALSYGAGAVIGMFNGLGKGLAEYNTIQDRVISREINGDFNNFYISTNVRIIDKQKIPVDQERHTEMRGRPCSKYLHISELSGFMNVKEIKLNLYNMATLEEQKECISLLVDGIYI